MNTCTTLRNASAKLLACYSWKGEDFQVGAGSSNKASRRRTASAKRATARTARRFNRAVAATGGAW
jgi:hypothetical protein